MIQLYEQKQNHKQNLIDSMLEIVTQGYGSEGKRVNFLNAKMKEALSKLDVLRKKLKITVSQEKFLTGKLIKSEETIAKNLSKLKKLIKEVDND